MTPTIRRSAGAGAVLLIVLLAWLVSGQPESAQVLSVPPRGQVFADAVEGAPVFVTHTESGEVHVLDAVSPPHPFGASKVLAWCRSAAVFEDLWHGSLFEPSGRWISGPAPTDMARYEVSDRTGGHVTVGEKQPAVEGPRCDVRTGLHSRNNPGTDPAVLVVHADIERFGDDLLFPTPERVLGEAPHR